EEAANLYGSFPKHVEVYPKLLADKGDKVGYSGKGWAPGNYEASGWSHNPAGVKFDDPDLFFQSVPENTPFCFWFGSTNPHRPYVEKSGFNAGMDSSKIVVPPYLPDVPSVRMDIL